MKLLNVQYMWYCNCNSMISIIFLMFYRKWCQEILYHQQLYLNEILFHTAPTHMHITVSNMVWSGELTNYKSIVCMYTAGPHIPVLPNGRASFYTYNITFNGPTHPAFNVEINTRGVKEAFHTSSMTFLCSKV